MLPCLRLNLGLCELSMFSVQFHFDRFRALHQDALNGCVLDTTSILLEDVSRPLAECNILFAEQLLTSLGIYNTFNEALCSSFYAHAACMMNTEIPFLLKYLRSRHDKFYSDFWTRSCANFDPNMPDGGGTGPGKRKERESIISFSKKPNTMTNLTEKVLPIPRAWQLIFGYLFLHNISKLSNSFIVTMVNVNTQEVIFNALMLAIFSTGAGENDIPTVITIFVWAWFNLTCADTRSAYEFMILQPIL